MSINILEFEKPIAEVADKIEALQLAASDNPELLPQINKLKSDNLIQFANFVDTKLIKEKYLLYI